MKFAEVYHYRWMDYRGADAGPIHSAVMFVGMAPRGFETALFLPIADTHYVTSMQSPIVAKSAASYEPCTDACPFNPDYEGASK